MHMKRTCRRAVITYWEAERILPDRVVIASCRVLLLRLWSCGCLPHDVLLGTEQRWPLPSLARAALPPRQKTGPVGWWRSGQSIQEGYYVWSSIVFWEANSVLPWSNLLSAFCPTPFVLFLFFVCCFPFLSLRFSAFCRQLSSQQEEPQSECVIARTCETSSNSEALPLKVDTPM